MTTPTSVVPPITEPSPHPATKPGWKTSEFWLAVASAIGGVLTARFASNTGAGIAGAIITTGATTAYSASRAFTKANAPTS